MLTRYRLFTAAYYMLRKLLNFELPLLVIVIFSLVITCNMQVFFLLSNLSY